MPSTRYYRRHFPGALFVVDHMRNYSSLSPEARKAQGVDVAALQVSPYLLSRPLSRPYLSPYLDVDVAALQVRSMCAPPSSPCPGPIQPPI